MNENSNCMYECVYGGYIQVDNIYIHECIEYFSISMYNVMYSHKELVVVTLSFSNSDLQTLQ